MCFGGILFNIEQKKKKEEKSASTIFRFCKGPSAGVNFGWAVLKLRINKVKYVWAFCSF